VRRGLFGAAGRLGTVCARFARPALLCGPSTSLLDGAMDERAHLLAELRRVFPPIVVPDRAAPHVCAECYRISEALAQRTWTQIPGDFVKANDGVLPLLSEKAYIAYLAAWLREGLEHPDDDVATMLFINLGDSPPTAGFTSEQGELIVALAKAMRDAGTWHDDPVRIEEVRVIERTWIRRAV
jgi:hypothetical protein